MKNYDYDPGLKLSFANVMGGFLVFVGVGVLIWVVISLFQLFTSSSPFLIMEGMVPKEVVLSNFGRDSRILLPREILVYGIPVWVLTAASKIGLTLLRGGLEYVDKPKKSTESEAK